MLYKCDKSTNYITKKQFSISHPFLSPHHFMLLRRMAKKVSWIFTHSKSIFSKVYRHRLKWRKEHQKPEQDLPLARHQKLHFGSF